MSQLHKKFTDSQIKELIVKFLNKDIERVYLQNILGIKKTRFFALIKNYRKCYDSFSIEYIRKNSTNKINAEVENNIIAELKIENKLINDPTIPIRSYNYSYIKDIIETIYDQRVSLPTIINRAKKEGFYLGKRQKSVHDREVLTNYAGELIQHDSSHHKWSPYAKDKWFLITSLDDYSVTFFMLL